MKRPILYAIENTEIENIEEYLNEQYVPEDPFFGTTHQDGPANIKYIANDLRIFKARYKDEYVKYIYHLGPERAVLAFDCNLKDFLQNPKKSISVDSKIEIGRANSFYWLFNNACSGSEDRIKKHGYDLKDIVPLQEAVCAIYRNNKHDRSKEFLKFLYSQDTRFVFNDCYNCQIKKHSCKLYIPELNKKSDVKTLRLGKLKMQWQR